MSSRIKEDLPEMKKKLSEYADRGRVIDYVEPVTRCGFEISGGRKI